MNWYQAILIIILIVSSLFIGWYLKDIYLSGVIHTLLNQSKYSNYSSGQGGEIYERSNKGPRNITKQGR